MVPTPRLFLPVIQTYRFILLYPQLDTGPLSCRSQGSLMACLTTYHDLCCHPLHNVAHAVFLENAWQNTFTPRAGSVKKREDELSLSLHMKDWKLDAVLIYVCFTHSLLKVFPPFVINKIYCVCVCSQLLQFCLTFCDPMDYSPPGSSVHSILQARILEWVATHPSMDLSDPGIEPMSPVSPALQADSLPTAPPGKPKIYFKWAKYIYIFTAVYWTL